MLGLARYAMKSPLHTGVLAALFAATPLLYFVSAALVALTTLRHGITYGTRTLLMAMAGGLVSWYLSGVPLSLLVLVLVTLLAEVLKATQSWSRTLILGSVIGLVLAFIAQNLFAAQFDSILDGIQQVFMTNGAGSVESQLLEMTRDWVGFILISSQLAEAVLTLLLARYWQAGLYNPGGLKGEMQALRFTRQEVVFLVAAVLVSVLYLPGAVMLFGIPLAFVGMALLHGIVTKLGLGGQWLVALYIGAVMFIQFILPLLVLVVIADSMIDLKSRIPERTKSDNE
ncbi:hypothetical protein [Reinekea marinisedimentorum]|uniref:Uncharacterized protein n=1 Tax=Reinekea marinisedimentorum TaxID=230495 RepID=A0A4R3I7Q1_9GAMM|nr:hypothetical protein [Reinekea marinisedimentorum]TCS40161.1 hypothetical protein BCF53_11082 [Reinekea marinisedimentorum]